MLRLILVAITFLCVSTSAAGNQLCSELAGEEEAAGFNLDRDYGLGQLEKLYDRSAEKTFLRFSYWLQNVQKRMKVEKLSDLPERMVKSNLRFHLFMVEELGRAYRTFVPEYDAIYKKVRTLENSLGKYQASLEVIETAQKLGLTAAEMKILEAKVESTKLDLTKVITNEGWRPDMGGRIPALAKILEMLTDANLAPTNRTERKKLLEYYAKTTKKISQSKYDMNLLEDGIHEFRRDIRKLQVVVFAKRGLTRLSPDHGLVRDKALIDKTDALDLSESKYLPRFNAYIDSAPVIVSKPYFLALIYYTEKFGELKDVGERKEVILELWLQNGRFDSRNEAEAHFEIMTKKAGVESVQVHVEAEKLYKEFQDFKILEGIYEEVRIAY